MLSSEQMLNRHMLSVLLQPAPYATSVCNLSQCASAPSQATMSLVQAMTVVRRFRGHTDRITDLTVSSDCRWLLSSSMDGTVRVWDIPDSRTFQVSDLIPHLCCRESIRCSACCCLAV